MATLDLKEMKNSFGKVGKKVCPVGSLSVVFLNWDSQQGRPFSLPSQTNFPIFFRPKVAIAEFLLKMQRKTWYSIFGVWLFFGCLGRATCTINLISAQTSQEGIENNKAKEWLRSYCLIYILFLLPCSVLCCRKSSSSSYSHSLRIWNQRQLSPG